MKYFENRCIDKYATMSLLQLAELIARNADRAALLELHNHRRGFYFHDRRSLSLAEFVSALVESQSARRWCNGNQEFLDRAYDLTISKFSNMPELEKNGQMVKNEGPNCRYYFEAYLAYATQRMTMKVPVSEIKREIKAFQLLQKLVVRHFRLSCLEACRQGTELKRRYQWKLNGHTLDLLLPVEIPGNERRRWLLEHISDVDPARPGERIRVQIIIDNLMKKRKIFSIQEMEKYADTVNLPCFLPDIEQEITVKGLAEAVADEKVDTLESQRCAIRQLGKRKLRRLIHQIFESLSCGDTKIGKIAQEFKINPSAFSRFAGSSWLENSKSDQNHSIPDLWFNTAQVLAGHSVFVRVAQECGIFERVKKILNRFSNGPENGGDDGL